MSDVSRRDALKLMGAVPLVGALEWSGPGVERATRMVARLHADADAAPYTPKFFTAHEWRTVRVLADMIIPKDERSGSATDAKAPEFIDFMLMDKETSEASRVSMRGGLAWLDTEMRKRFAKDFFSASDVQRRASLTVPSRSRTPYGATGRVLTRSCTSASPPGAGSRRKRDVADIGEA